MQAKFIIFSKVPTENGKKILFALTNADSEKFPQFDLARNSASALAKKNMLARHESFDWYFNKSTGTRIFLFEKYIENEHSLMPQINNLKEDIAIEWKTFPQAIQKLSCGKERNLLQLSVQYISSGGIDENVIVADYDQDFLKKLQNHLKQK
jgi:hypothetical protein